MQTTPAGYRPEIDGLRAVAIVSVVLFHADVPGFGGGYVGVDVFFAISGYLITGILLQSVDDRTFSIRDFYERRIRRIFPALMVVLAACTALAMALLFADELVNFGKSLFATSLFFANVYFTHDTGYFAAPAASKPLLHMWSLSVEEQFYVVFPLYLYAVNRWLRRYLIPLTIFLCLLSFAHSVWAVERAPEQAFYSAPARFWELMSGALLAMMARSPRSRIPHRLTSEVLASVGLIAVLASIVFYSDTTLFPAAAAIPPVLGCCAVIYATAAPGSVAARLLGLSPIRFIGLISYSLYLWHWPVLIYYRLFVIRPVQPIETGGLVLAAVILASLTWRYIEIPCRRRGAEHRRRTVLLLGASALGAGAIFSSVLVLGGGFPGRFGPEIRDILAASKDLPDKGRCDFDRGPHPIQLCAFGVGRAEEATTLVWGDSHADALMPAIDAASKTAGVPVLLFFRNGCVPLLGVRQTGAGFRSCPQDLESVISYLIDHPRIKRVVLVARWARYANGERYKGEIGRTIYITDDDAMPLSREANRQVFERGLERTLSRLSALGRDVVLVGQVPEAEYSIPEATARVLYLNRQIELAPLKSDYAERQRFVEQLFKRMSEKYSSTEIDPAQILCPGYRCAVEVDQIPIYRDSTHLTASGARRLSRIFDPLFSPGDH